MEKKGLSGVITVVILIALAIVMITVVWGVVNGLIKDKIKSAESCSDLFDKVKLNKVYTCADFGDQDVVDKWIYNNTNETLFSVNVGNIEVESYWIKVAFGGSAQSFELIDGQAYVFLKERGKDYNTPIDLVKKNQGKTYVIKTDAGFFDQGANVPTTISIAPVINGEECGVVDTATEIEACGNI